MTLTLGNHRIRPVRRQRSEAGIVRRGLAWIKYDVLLVPTGILVTADAIAGEPAEAGRRWPRSAGQEARTPEAASWPEPSAEPRGATVFGLGLVSAVLGLISWFLLILLLLAVVRGPFYGFVEPGPYGPGTWGGPTPAGAWAVHAAVAVPIIALIPVALWGLGALHAALVRRAYGASTARWVLPATIVLCAGGMWFFWSWIQQL